MNEYQVARFFMAHSVDVKEWIVLLVDIHSHSLQQSCLVSTSKIVYLCKL